MLCRRELLLMRLMRLECGETAAEWIVGHRRLARCCCCWLLQLPPPEQRAGGRQPAAPVGAVDGRRALATPAGGRGGWGEGASRRVAGARARASFSSLGGVSSLGSNHGVGFRLAECVRHSPLRAKCLCRPLSTGALSCSRPKRPQLSRRALGSAHVLRVAMDLCRDRIRADGVWNVLHVSGRAYVL